MAQSTASWSLRLLLVRLRFVGLMVVVAFVVATWDRAVHRLHRWWSPPAAVAASSVEWYCPMDPQVVRGEPASCPICGMPLSKRAKGAPEALPGGTLARLRLGPRRVALAGLTTVEVARRPVEVTVDAVGTMDVDERRLARIAARVRGRADTLFVDFTGTRVEKGQRLVWLYSQDIYASSRELLLARAAGGAALEAAKRRLLLWGLAPEQVERMVQKNEPETHVEVLSPIAGTVLTKSVVAGDYVEEGTSMYTVADLSALWMVARVYEDEARRVRLGQAVEIRASAWPERTFEGHVSFVEPQVDRATRTVGVRVDVPNGHGLLRPGMAVRATLRARVGPDGTVGAPATEVVWRCCAACPEIEARAPGPCPKCGMALMPVERPTAEAHAHAWECRCPMHPDRVFEASGPGACGLCGAPLTPVTRDGVAAVASPAATAKATRTVWECPGHPDQNRDAPGICVKCGTMELIPREVPVDEPQPPRTQVGFVCPMHPEVVKDRPGDCPICHMKLEMKETPLAPAPAAARTKTVYECPMHPDQTKDAPGECAPCGGMKLIPREVPVEGAAADAAPVDPLVVPVDAVVDTGPRQVVFVEVSEGVYDAVQVTVGPRAGDLVPVISGLRAGQKVVARGAFLLDAEVRLAPGAAATYFGASGQTGGGR